jgi:trehalose 6-phosphate phosphatase
MTKHATFVADDAVAAPAQQHFSSFPPLATADARDRKKDSAVQIDLAAAGVVPGAAWVETMKSSSPRRVFEGEHSVWMVRTCYCYMPRIERSFYFLSLHPLGACLLEFPAPKSVDRFMANPDRAQESLPSALAWFESALSAAKGKHIVMFLDYDGTLSPIVKDPDAAVMSDEASIFFLPSLFASASPAQ